MYIFRSMCIHVCVYMNILPIQPFYSSTVSWRVRLFGHWLHANPFIWTYCSPMAVPSVGPVFDFTSWPPVLASMVAMQPEWISQPSKIFWSASLWWRRSPKRKLVTMLQQQQQHNIWYWFCDYVRWCCCHIASHEETACYSAMSWSWWLYAPCGFRGALHQFLHQQGSAARRGR